MALEYGPLIERYGYLATFAGTLIEGESLLILSGLAAHRGYLSLPLVVAVGALGGALGDLIFFLLGRHYGNNLLARFPRFAPAADRVHAMIERHPTTTILVVRFMYGLRTAGPAIIGSTKVPLAEFACVNAIGALLWSACWTAAGYLLGKAAEHLLGDLAKVERELFGAAIVAIVFGIVAWHVWRARGARRAPLDQANRLPTITPARPAAAAIASVCSVVARTRRFPIFARPMPSTVSTAAVAAIET